MKHEEDKKKKKASKKEAHLEELRETLSGMSSSELSKMMKIVQFDTVNEMLEALKNFETTPIDVWEKIVMKLQVLRKVKVSNVKETFDFNKFLDILLGLLGIFLGTAFAFKCNQKSDITAAEPTPKDTYPTINGNVPNPLPKETDVYTGEILSAEGDAYPAKKDDLYIYKAAIDELKKLQDSIIFTYCNTHYDYWNFRPTTMSEYEIWKETGFLADHAWDTSTNEENETIDNNPETEYTTEKFLETPCCVSMCKEEESTDFEELFSTQLLANNSTRVVVEFDRNHPHTLSVEEAQRIKPNDIIGYIENIPVKSKISCVPEKVTADYFIGYYDTSDTAEINYEEEVAKYQYIDDAMLEINELLQTNIGVISFIKDFIIFTRKPFIALHTREHVDADSNVISFEEYLTEYENKGRDIITEYNNLIKSRMTEDFLKPYAENNKIVEVKKILDDDKNTMTNKIIDWYNNYNKIKYASKGRIADFLLCDTYIEYITGDDFYYDETNPYIVELFDAIQRFIQRRLRVEKNSDTIPDEITNFNELCDSTLKEYYPKGMSDYYETFNIILANNSGSLNELHPEYDDSTTLFTKTLDYLKTLTSYIKPESPTETYSDDMDVAKILKEKKSSETQDENIKKLRKIALAYVALRARATSPLDESMFQSDEISTYASSNKDFVNDYYTGYEYNYIDVIKDTDIYQKQTILENYLSSLKKITESESKTLDEIVKKAIEWYQDNYKTIDDAKFFNQFREIAWPEPSTIYQVCVQHDFYYVEYRESTYDELLNNNGFGLSGDANNDTSKSDSGNNSKKNNDKKSNLPTCPLDFENYDIDNDDTNMYVNSESGPNTYLYWLKYMGWATLVNVMLPIYWSTGLVISGVPIPLPIIYLPIVAVQGRVTIVFGLGICGICPLPMIYLVNMSNTKGTVLFPINFVIDSIVNGIKAIIGNQSKLFEISLTPLIDTQDIAINSVQKEIDDTQQQINNIKDMIKGNKLTLKNAKRRSQKASTSCEYKKETSN